MSTARQNGLAIDLPTARRFALRVMALMSFGSRAGSDAQHAMRAFLVGEAVKLGLVVVLFVVVLKVLKVSPAALFAAYVATFVVYWIALASALPIFGALAVPCERKE